MLREMLRYPGGGGMRTNHKPDQAKGSRAGRQHVLVI